LHCCGKFFLHLKVDGGLASNTAIFPRTSSTILLPSHGCPTICCQFRPYPLLSPRYSHDCHSRAGLQSLQAMKDATETRLHGRTWNEQRLIHGRTLYAANVSADNVSKEDLNGTRIQTGIVSWQNCEQGRAKYILRRNSREKLSHFTAAETVAGSYGKKQLSLVKTKLATRLQGNTPQIDKIRVMSK